MAGASLVQLMRATGPYPRGRAADHATASGEMPMAPAMETSRPPRSTRTDRPDRPEAATRSARPPRSGRRRHAGRLLAGAVGLGLAALVGATSARAEDASAGIGTPPVDARWRARGVAFVDLPFGLRARYDAQALHRLNARGDLSPAFLDLDPRASDATRRGIRLLESRFALSRAIAPHVEVELSWAARSPLTMVDLLRIEDQRVAAMIRIVPR